MDKKYLINEKALTFSPKIVQNNLWLNNIVYPLNFFLSKQVLVKNNIIYSNKFVIFKIFHFVKNILKRLNIGFCTILELFGLSFTVTKKKDVLRLNIGYTHSVYYKVPADVYINTKKKRIYLFSFSLFRLNSVVAELIKFRPLSAYKLKGIKDKDNIYIKKKMNLTK